MAPNTIGVPSRRNDWGVNLLALAIVAATIVIGYGLAHPRDLPLPFGADASVAAARVDRETESAPVKPSPVALREGGGADVASGRR